MSQDKISAAAAALHAARVSSTAIDPISESFAIKDLAAAYAVQNHNTERLLADGGRIVGRKIGLTSQAVQQQLGVDQPDYGVLFADMAVASGDEIDLATMIAPRVEAEIAFVMARGLADPDVTPGEVEAAIAYALPAIEVVDSAIRDWRISLVDTVADNASCGRYVLGRTPVSLRGLDLRLCGMVMEDRGRTVSLGTGAACLGHPVAALHWLARTMCANGRPIAEGDVVLSGALGPMVGAVDGARYVAEIGGLGSVSIAFGRRQ
jgi:2-keto-4-pentenoate hydratase